MRAEISVGPPGGNGTTILTALSGQKGSTARAAVPDASSMSAIQHALAAGAAWATGIPRCVSMAKPSLARIGWRGPHHIPPPILAAAAMRPVIRVDRNCEAMDIIAPFLRS